MSKVIAGINMTLDGVYDHTVITPGEEMNQHYIDLLNGGGTLLYGRTTYELMEEYWPALVKTPSGDRSSDDFAKAIDSIDKVLFSRTRKSVTWRNSRLAVSGLQEEIESIRKNSQRDILIGSRSLIVQALNQNLVDEFQLMVHPTIEGKGMKLFDEIDHRIQLRLMRTKTIKDSGAVVFYYQPKP